MPEHPCRPKIPPTIHVVNIMALLLGGVILLLTAVDRTYQLLILVPVLGLLVGYWRLRGHPRVVAWYFGMAMALLGWILICEHIVTFDNVFGTQISRRLSLVLHFINACRVRPPKVCPGSYWGLPGRFDMSPSSHRGLRGA
jgi:hypothetical protein